MFEIRKKDLCARIASLHVKHGKFTTPTLMPVINPNYKQVTVKEMQKMGAEVFITNAYLLWKNHKEKVIKEGVHKFIGFDGPIMTDSGAFQLMQYGKIQISNEEVIRFQEDIGVDIGVPIDIPGLASKQQTRKNLETTIANATQLQNIKTNPDVLWAGPIQGGVYPDLRTESCNAMQDLGFEYFSLGSMVPLLTRYNFESQVDIIATCKQTLPLNSPVHHFGAGHPMFFAFSVALGCDIFDSAAYALFAKDGKYLTVSGTRKVSELVELPCSCPVCSAYTAKELDEGLLAKHNLEVSFQELRTIRQAIHENTLWELLEQRARAHRSMPAAFKAFSRHTEYIESLDVFTRRRFFPLSQETKNRPEITRHKKKKLSSKNFLTVLLFGKVPEEVLDMYPFGSMNLPVPQCSDIEIINGIAEYQYGVKNLFPKHVKVQHSKTTGRIRKVYDGDELLAVLDHSTYTIIPKGIAVKLHKKTKKWRVVVENEVAEFAIKGLNVFNKFVVSCDEEIRAGMEVLVVDEKDNLLNVGKARLCAREIADFNTGVAVQLR